MFARKALSAALSTPAAEPVYVEDVFSTYLYKGTGSAFYINNGIDVNGEGGLYLIKGRSQAAADPANDAGRWFAASKESGASDELAFYDGATATTNAATSVTAPLWFTTSGQLVSGGAVNTSNQTYASWTFRKAEKFFDVVTWTGDGTSNRQISHSLGSTPGCVIVKNTSSASDWPVYHRSLGFTSSDGLRLNGTNATGTYAPPISAASSTTITLTTSGSNTNQSGQTFVAYLFAHDAGGFGDDGTDSVIKCGSYTGTGSDTSTDNFVNLGFEPQWILYKNASASASWALFDNMRGITDGDDAILFANTTAAESTSGNGLDLTSTGFRVRGTSTTYNTSGSTYIYIAIRRGPMKTPESGADVYTSDYRTGGFVSGFPVDFALMKNLYTPDSADWQTGTRLLGTKKLATTSTAAETTDSNFTFDNMTGWYNGTPPADNQSWMFRRAPGFFDVVCYTGTGTARTVSHNLGVAPELMIVKKRSGSSQNWAAYASPLGNTKYLRPNENISESTSSTHWNNTSPTSSVFTVGTDNDVNARSANYVAYLFASVTGVSKVGTYTGNGSSQTINCGFTTGARFVLVKRTDSTGDWVVFDSARGIVSGNDPYLRLNSTAAEVTDKDAVDTDSTGFVVNETSGPNINTNGATYIYLSIA